MQVCFISSEATPFSKTGGMGDVSGALPLALNSLGADVTLITPYYALAEKRAEKLGLQLRPGGTGASYRYVDEEYPVRWLETICNGLRVILIQNADFYDREGLYVDYANREYADNLARFSFFSQAALHYCLSLPKPPQIVHANDWQAALVPALMRSAPFAEAMSGSRSVLTIHNLGYQGSYDGSLFAQTGLDWQAYNMNAFEYYGQVNLLKGGIAYADAVTTVSPTYAREITTPEQGMGLDGFLSARQGKLSGILNGIDTLDWDPSGDLRLPANYSLNDMEGKSYCRSALQGELGLEHDRDAILLGTISRFDAQKGVDLLLEALPLLDGINWQLALLGSGDKALEAAATEFAKQHHGRVAVRLGFDEALARRIYAGCDAIVMPSLYEPCGLNQMYAQRYGSVPVVRSTGGLRDTVQDATPERLADGSASGFSFSAIDPTELAAAVRRCAELRSLDRKAWTGLLRSIMQIDHSWRASASAYLELFRRISAAPEAANA